MNYDKDNRPPKVGTISKALKAKYDSGYQNPMKGRQMSDAAKEAISLARKGKQQSDESKQLISESKKGRKQSPEHIQKRTEARLAKKEDAKVRNETVPKAGIDPSEMHPNFPVEDLQTGEQKTSKLPNETPPNLVTTPQKPAAGQAKQESAPVELSDDEPEEEQMKRSADEDDDDDTSYPEDTEPVNDDGLTEEEVANGYYVERPGHPRKKRIKQEDIDTSLLTLDDTDYLSDMKHKGKLDDGLRAIYEKQQAMPTLRDDGNWVDKSPQVKSKPKPPTLLEQKEKIDIIEAAEKKNLANLRALCKKTMEAPDNDDDVDYSGRETIIDG